MSSFSFCSRNGRMKIHQTTTGYHIFARITTPFRGPVQPQVPPGAWVLTSQHEELICGQPIGKLKKKPPAHRGCGGRRLRNGPSRVTEGGGAVNALGAERRRANTVTLPQGD